MPARSKAWQVTKAYPHASRPRTGASVGAHLEYPNEIPEGYRSPAQRVKDGGNDADDPTHAHARARRLRSSRALVPCNAQALMGGYLKPLESSKHPVSSVLLSGQRVPFEDFAGLGGHGDAMLPLVCAADCHRVRCLRKYVRRSLRDNARPKSRGLARHFRRVPTRFVSPHPFGIPRRFATSVSHAARLPASHTRAQT
jgi:hypothetical protein